MYAIIGAAGKVGFATASALRKANLPVKAIVRDATKAEHLRQIDCTIATAALLDTDALTAALGDVAVVQVILPPNPKAKDGAHEMRMIIESIATALERTTPGHILIISDYGAHVPSDIGMPSTYRALEERLARLPGRKTILRSAPHMQNWGRVIQAARDSGSLPSFQDPVDMLQPTIPASDLGRIAAELLQDRGGVEEARVVHAEGPRRYSAADVATAMSELLGRSVKAVAVPRDQWQAVLGREMSESLAELLVKANDAQNKGGEVDVEPGGEVRYGTTELIDALRPLVV